MSLTTHQYIDRHSGQVRTERLFADRLVNFLYSEVREKTPTVFKAITSARGSSLLGLLNFEAMLGVRLKATTEAVRSWGVDLGECLDDPATLDTPGKLFTRKIRYWQTRPMNPEPSAVVAPADSRVLLGSFGPHSLLFIKEKFFAFHELLGDLKTRWLEAFKDGDYALCRLTPDKYHYVHTPVSGRVVDFYPIAGHYHSCNPGAVVSLVDPYSKNMRMVTIIDTDVDGGSGVGLVAVVEVVALMVGEISQRYSQEFYDDPQPMTPGLMLTKGQPKSLFKPGSSTVVCLFQPGRMDFDQDLIDNQASPKAVSRFSCGFGQPLVETEVRVREQIGRAAARS